MTSNWREQGRCSELFSGQDNPFFSNNPIEQRTALAFCKGCPVKRICLDEAIANDDLFVRGGTTHEQRKIMSLFMVALTPIESSQHGPSDTELLYMEHTVEVSIHMAHTSTPEQPQVSPTQLFELDQSVLGVSGIRRLSEVVQTQAESVSSPSPLFSLNLEALTYSLSSNSYHEQQRPDDADSSSPFDTALPSICMQLA